MSPRGLSMRVVSKALRVVDFNTATNSKAKDLLIKRCLTLELKVVIVAKLFLSVEGVVRIIVVDDIEMWVLSLGVEKWATRL